MSNPLGVSTISPSHPFSQNSVSSANVRLFLSLKPLILIIDILVCCVQLQPQFKVIEMYVDGGSLFIAAII